MQDEIAEKEGLYRTASLPRSLLSGPLNYTLPKANYLPTNKRRSWKRPKEKRELGKMGRGERRRPPAGPRPSSRPWGPVGRPCRRASASGSCSSPAWRPGRPSARAARRKKRRTPSSTSASPSPQASGERSRCTRRLRRRVCGLAAWEKGCQVRDPLCLSLLLLVSS